MVASTNGGAEYLGGGAEYLGAESEGGPNIWRPNPSSQTMAMGNGCRILNTQANRQHK